MEYILTKGNTTAKFRDYGGEITELTVDGVNYIWNGDPKHWRFHAPVLFPIVCRLKDGAYTHEGKRYELSGHGFGRTSVYEASQEGDSITFSLKSSEDTLKNYPFTFILKIKYVLEEAGVKVYYIVENTGDKTMYFSIGGHTAFMCPFEKEGKFEDYYLELSEEETADRLNSDENGLIMKERTADFLKNEKIIEIKNRQMLNDTIIFDSLKSSKVSLKSRSTDKYIEFDFTGFPYMAFWTFAEDTPFVCIEPWYGLPDESQADGELSHKLGILSLEAGKKFECLQAYSIKALTGI